MQQQTLAPAGGDAGFGDFQQQAPADGGATGGDEDFGSFEKANKNQFDDTEGSLFNLDNLNLGPDVKKAAAAASSGSAGGATNASPFRAGAPTMVRR